MMLLLCSYISTRSSEEGRDFKFAKILVPFQGGWSWGNASPAASPAQGGLCRRLYSLNPSGFGGCVIPRKKWLKKPDFTVRYHVTSTLRLRVEKNLKYLPWSVNYARRSHMLSQLIDDHLIDDPSSRKLWTWTLAWPWSP